MSLRRPFKSAHGMKIKVELRALEKCTAMDGSSIAICYRGFDGKSTSRRQNLIYFISVEYLADTFLLIKFVVCGISGEFTIRRNANGRFDIINFISANLFMKTLSELTPTPVSIIIPLSLLLLLKVTFFKDFALL
jgi:hypothetical protein